MPPQSASERLLDEQILHSAQLQRVGSAAAREILRLMDSLDRELSQRIAELVGRLAARFTAADLRKAARLRQLEDALARVARDLGSINRRNYGRIASRLLHRTEGGRWAGVLAEIADHELGIQQRLLGGAMSNAIGVVRPSIEHLLGIVESKPFEGLLLKDWFRDMGKRRMTRLQREIRLGLLADESMPQIAKRYRSVMKVSRREAELFTHSAVQHVAGEVRDRLYQQNSDLISAEVWLATLDTRTCEICIPRDKKRYTVGEHKPIGHKIPWKAGPGRIHLRCRCTASAVLKSWQELGLNFKDIPPELRRSMDGTVPASTDYAEWAGRASEERLADVFGARRASLIKSGKLPVERLFDARGEMFSLSQLMERERRAFKRAGL